MEKKYRKLMGNSLIFAIGNFGSKIMSFVMVPVYSYTLSTNDFGKVDMLTTLTSLILPIACLEIYDSVFRFALDKNENKSEIFSTGLIMSIISSCLMFLIGFILAFLIKDYPIMYTAIYMIVSLLFSLISNFSRAIGEVRSFAIAGIINTFVMGICNVILLVFVKLGMTGYMLSLILGQVAAILFIVYSADIIKFFKVSLFSKNKLKEMMRYGIPLTPNNLAWWLNSASDRVFILGMLGSGANGIYAMAGKVPGIITTVNTVFFQSWQMSVVEEYEKKDGKKFISTVFESYISILFFVGIGILSVIKPLYKIILSSNYFVGWKLTPLLVLAVIYTSIASFLGTVYTASKRTVSILVTTIIGAIINVILTIILIKLLGSNGAALANASSFFVVSFLRFREIKKMGKISLNVIKFVLLHILFFITYLTLFIFKDDVLVFLIAMSILFIQMIIDSNLRHMIVNTSKKLVNKFF